MPMIDGDTMLWKGEYIKLSSLSEEEKAQYYKDRKKAGPFEIFCAKQEDSAELDEFLDKVEEFEKQEPGKYLIGLVIQ